MTDNESRKLIQKALAQLDEVLGTLSQLREPIALREANDLKARLFNLELKYTDLVIRDFNNCASCGVKGWNTHKVTDTMAPGLSWNVCSDCAKLMASLSSRTVTELE